MSATLGVLAGLVLALGTVYLARRWEPATALRVYAIGLVATASVYVALALAGRASTRWVAIEALGVALYGGAAWLGLRRWLPALALGWAAHVVWDLAFHSLVRAARSRRPGIRGCVSASTCRSPAP
jgi:hypothetical protein